MKNISLILSLLLMMILSFSSCNKNWRTYRVKAGHHSANVMGPLLMNVDEIQFQFKVDSTWYYSEPELPGWNKIRGLSHGHHQENSSARLVYQCLNNSVLVVGAYCYVNGINPMENPSQNGIIDTIMPGNVYHCAIRRYNDKYVIDFEDKTWEGPAGEDLNWGYLLNPYVGGELTFDHDWFVKIKDLKNNQIK